MAIKKVKSGWQADLQPEGRGGKRVRKTFPTKKQAENFEVQQKAKANSGEWSPPVKDSRRLQGLIDEWFSLHGHTLKDGNKRKQKLDAICRRLGNPLARNFSGEDFLRYRKQRLSEKQARRDKPNSPNNLNHEQAYLSAVFGKLIQLRNWKLANPLQGIQKISLDESDLIYLELDQIQALLDALADSRNPDVLVIAKICLATGSRWGEAQGLEGQRVRNGQVHFVKTKNSKARAVPIDPELETEIRQGRPQIGPLFPRSGYDAFKSAVQRAGIQLPDGQLTHVLRHTFASHFMINDGNILKLQSILGHKTLAMTMRYAKLAPRHLSQAIDKNPLRALKCQQSVNASAQERAQTSTKSAVSP